MTERKKLIERLRDATEGPRMLMGEAADMLEADAPAVPQEPVAWQPIETAPKDGSRVLLWWDGAAREGWCAGAGKSRDGGDWWRSHSLTVCAGRPTQWMSLPPAPEGSPQKSPVLTDAEIIQAIEQRFAPAVSAVPVAYLAWRDGKPCWEGDDCVCADAVYPVDHDDDRTSMPVYLAPQQQTATSDEWLANCPQSVRDLANKIKAEMAVPQEPVAILNHAHGLHAIRSVKLDGLPDGEYKLYAAPQRPRLTDAEIDALAEWHALDFMTYMPFARAIEKKVRGEA